MKIWFPSKTVWKPDLGVPEKGNIPVGDAGGVVLPDEGIKKNDERGQLSQTDESRTDVEYRGVNSTKTTSEVCNLDFLSRLIQDEAEQLVSFIAVVAECGSVARSFNRKRNGHNGKTSKEDLLQKTTVA